MSGQFRAAKSALAEFGFNVFFDDDGADTLTPWLTVALRELQAHSTMPVLARKKAGATNKRWLENLESAANTRVYTGPIDGVLTPDVQALIDHWRTNNFRCPVVFDLFVNIGLKEVWPPLDNNGQDSVVGNFWRYDDPRILTFVGTTNTALRYTKLQVRVCDMSGHFEAAHLPDRPLKKIGRLQKHYGFTGAALADSAVIGRDSEVLPKVMTGKDWSALGDTAQRTFRVVRAVAERECLGYLQSINGYDDAWISLGPCHWTLGLSGVTKPGPPQQKVGPGELPAYLAYWASEAPVDVKRVLTRPFGVGFAPAWKKGESGKSADQGWKAARNYTGYMTCQAAGGTEQLDTFGQLDWFRTLPWYWRFLAVIRNVESFRQRQWNMTRLRLRDLLAYEIDPSDRPGQDPGPNKVALSTLITSEAGVALLLRLHVRKSGYISSKTFKAPSLRLALALAGIAEKDVTKWTDTHELQLIEGLAASAAYAGLSKAEGKMLKGVKVIDLPLHRRALAEADSENMLRKDVRLLLAWPNSEDFTWGGGKGRFTLDKVVATPSLRRTRNSLKFDQSDLPPLPGAAP